MTQLLSLMFGVLMLIAFIVFMLGLGVVAGVVDRLIMRRRQRNAFIAWKGAYYNSEDYREDYRAAHDAEKVARRH
jgi:hypothetical protein